MGKKAIVIGAGIGGIAVAIRLRAKGYEVSIFEKSNHLGGKLNELRWEGFRWDTGPSLFTLPELIDELFALFPEHKQDFTYHKLKLITKYFFEDGTIINAHSDIQDFAKEIEDKTTVTKETVLKFLNRSKTIYELTAPVFIFSLFPSFRTYLSKAFIKAMLQWYKLDVNHTMHSKNTRVFRDNRIIQLFDRYATYNGSDPYQAPATLNVIPHLEHNIGAFFPEKGMYSIISSLAELLNKTAVDIHTNEMVTHIKSSGNQIQGITTTKGTYQADLVVYNSDIVYLPKLLPGIKNIEKYQKQPRSSSALIFYWAINKEFPNLDLHNVFYSANYREEFNCIFKTKTIYTDPTVYLFISSKEIKNDAPAGKENWFVMINVPEMDEQDWDTEIQNVKTNIIKKLNRALDTNMEDNILHEKILDPPGIQKLTNSFKGSLYGSSSNNKFAAFKRHPNYAGQYKDLYFVGGSVHPGGGIPLCLAGAKIVEKLL